MFLENKKISQEFTGYKAWVKERKQLRKDLNQCGMISDWLRSKPSLTEIERRVQDLQTTASNELSVSRMREEVCIIHYTDFLFIEQLKLHVLLRKKFCALRFSVGLTNCIIIPLCLVYAQQCR